MFEKLFKKSKQSVDTTHPLLKAIYTQLQHIDDFTIKDFMVPRTDLTFAHINDKMEDIAEKFVEDEEHYVLIIEDSVDDIIGILFIEDFLDFVVNNKSKNIKRFIEKRLQQLPETTKLLNFLSDYINNPHDVYIVIDNYGGLAGVLDINYLLKPLFGLGDTYIDRKRKGIYDVDPKVNINILEGILPKKVFDEEVNRHLSIGAFVIKQLGHIPLQGEIVYEDDLVKIKAIKVSENKIEKLRLIIKKSDE